MAQSPDPDEPAPTDARGSSPAEEPVSGFGASPRRAYRPGDLLAGKYRLVSILGEGGMGAVWLAKNEALDLDVAIKLIHHDATQITSQQLLSEVRAAARLVHPSIVRVFDLGETEHADPFIVMEVLCGETLADVFARKGRLEALVAVRTLLPVLAALTAAHAKGVVHRDLKPGNILLVADESGWLLPKVLDFGVAKLVMDDPPPTLGDAVMGTPEYLSPEQAAGRGEPDRRVDVWAVAVVLYEAACGRRPFEGSNVRALLHAIMTEEPAALTALDAEGAPLASGADDALWSIVRRGLAKEPSARWQTIRGLGVALAGWAVERGAVVDIAGAPIAATWLAEVRQRPLSDVPPRDSPKASTPGPHSALATSRELSGKPCSGPAASIPKQGVSFDWLEDVTRRAPGAAVRILASVEGLGSEVGSKNLANILALSEHALLLESQGPLPLGSTGSIRFFLPGSPQRVTVEGVIERVIDPAALHYGVTFVDLGATEREWIRSFLRKRATQRAEAGG